MISSEIKEVLEKKGVTPSRKLGQNFLMDANVAKWIVAQLDPQSEDTVIEVGPGTGALSEHLAPIVKRLILVEYDSRLAEYLREEKFKDYPNVEVISADGARIDTRRFYQEQPIKFLGNLPYSSGGAIMRNFLKHPSPITKSVLMLQKEFIDRIVAKAKTKEYGVLSLRMQAEWDSRPIKTVPPEAFHPRPQIDSTVMLVEPRKEALPVYDQRLFDELIRRGFAQRRKQVRKAMPEFPVWAEVCAQFGIEETARAEEIPLETWVEMTRLYDDHPLKDIPQKADELFDVVDENDEVVGQEVRSKVHEHGLRHRAVHILLRNQKKEFFIQKRSRLKDMNPGKWGTSAAGHLDAGESYAEAARRELEEELGVEDAPIQLAGKLSPSEGNGNEFIEVYFGLHPGGSVRFPCSEVEAGIWIGEEDLIPWLQKRPQDFSGSFRECWNLYESLK